jgi:hypothetical protein
VTRASASSSWEWRVEEFSQDEHGQRRTCRTGVRQQRDGYTPAGEALAHVRTL